MNRDLLLHPRNVSFVRLIQATLCLGAFVFESNVRAQIPQYDHVVVVIMENHNYSEIIGSPSAPYINSLATGGALFTSSHGTEHPSQPNYLDLFSGFNQGQPATDNYPINPTPGNPTATTATNPFTTPNLGASLLTAGHTFKTYSEDLPAVGSLVESNGDYKHKHNPSANWQSSTPDPAGNHTLPASTNVPFFTSGGAKFFGDAASATDFSGLPTVSFVVPNQQNDMHDGTILQGDTWVSLNIQDYAQWALTHKSLLILTFDEGSEDPNTPVDGAGNRVVTLFYGQGVITGQYSEAVTHFTILRTLENMYHLPTSNVGDAAATPITDVFAVPEPSSVLLTTSGGLLAGIVALMRRRKNKSPQLHRRIRRRRKFVLVFRVALLGSISLAIVDLRATTVIAPNALPDPNSSGMLPATQTYGDTSNLLPLFPGVGTALHYQQVYGASQFSALAPGGENITEILFRVGADAAARADHGAFTTTIPAIEFTLSTTSATPDNLSSTFASNLGADAVVVYGAAGVGAPLALASSGSVSGNPAPFDIAVVLTTPFHYNPANGNLLLDIQNFGGAGSPTGIQLDGTLVNGDSVSRAYNFGSATAVTANNMNTLGVVTEFVTVPEPRSFLLLTAAGALLVGFRAWRRA